MSAPQPGPETWSAPVPYGPSSPAPTPGARRSPLAVVAFVAGTATVLVGAVFTLAFPFVLSSSGYSPSAAGVLQLVNGILTGLLALVAAVAGAVALGRRLPGTALASGGTALGAAALLGVVLGLVQGALYQVL
ncbi:hypothetical protein [Cellulosimicrobium cellulans]|uniref:hypothetical protein n=1 Tax=Cellulosimicrobium cellulans TaxID=1710 RepID=UPI002406B562|nr:hypothetical protein [Cellulosimicrobium cellulans]MDF9875308.1 hypothetical protein [Cellulosimicrobium cellulans]